MSATRRKYSHRYHHTSAAITFVRFPPVHRQPPRIDFTAVDLASVFDTFGVGASHDDLMLRFRLADARARLRAFI